MQCQNFRFFVILSVALWQIFQLPELPEHSSANVTYVMIATEGYFWQMVGGYLAGEGGRIVLCDPLLDGGQSFAKNKPL